MGETTTLSSTVAEVKAAIQTLRPYLQSHGGDLDFVDFDEANGIARVRLQGMCGGCPHASETLRYYVEREIVRSVPQVKSVIAG
jgi:Fe-S cluster biogenesis protein NfuA